MNLQGRQRRRSRFWLWAGITAVPIVLGIIAWVAIARARETQLREGLTKAQGDMAAGRLQLAREGLTQLADGWPGNGEVLTLLGRCEESLGRPQRALAAWEKVATTDPSFGTAAESRGHLLITLGRYADAESFLTSALEQVSGKDRYAILRTLGRLLRIEGRFADVSDALIAAYPDAPDSPALLQELWSNDTELVPLQGWKTVLGTSVTKDDRQWLARARLALQSGNTDEAKSWLDRCLESRPDDSEVWRARLDLALATDAASLFWEAARHLPAEGLRPWEIAELRCRLAEQGGDRAAERRELEKLAELRPTQALERLAELSVLAGDREESLKLRRRKAELDTAKDQMHRYAKVGTTFIANAAEVAKLSAKLGRSFDQAAWSLVALGAGASGPDVERAKAVCQAAADEAFTRLRGNLRRAVGSVEASNGSQTLGDLLADLRPSTTSPTIAQRAADAMPDFTEDAETVGLKFTFDSGRSPQWLLPEILAGGVGLLDFDGDGWVDVYCVQGGPTDPEAPGGGDRLFRNRRDGTFEDVTDPSGIGRFTRKKGLGQGVTVGDYDNDGRPDLFVTRIGTYGLFHNAGGGTFEDVTVRAGLDKGDRQNATSAAFADLDNDGDLDLYVCHYGRWDADHLPVCKTLEGNPYYCDPARYEAAPDRVFRNDKGVFTDVTEAAGFVDPNGRGLGVVATDIDDDGKIDLYVANDGTANLLFKNLGDFRFEEVGMASGAAGNAEGAFRAGMGVVAADLDGDGQIDIFVNNLHGEGSTFYRNLGGGLFADHSGPSGANQATRYLTGFGVVAFDATNTGRVYLATANGHVNDFRPLHPYTMPCRLLEARPGGRFVDISDKAGEPWSVARLGRGLTSGDLDNDGRVDLVVVCQDEPLAYFHNRTERPGHFLSLLLEGTASNRDAVGAKVSITAGGTTQNVQRTGGGSYLSASDPRLHFGLGPSPKANAVVVRWPSGRTDRYENLAADSGYVLREGDPKPRALANRSKAAAASK